LINRVKRVQPKGALLDIGCSYGFLLLKAKAEGYKAYGVELAQVPFEYCRDDLGLDVFHGTVEAAQYSENSFSVVTAANVLEHVPDPMATLKTIHRVLAPGGVVALVVPNLLTGMPLILFNRCVLRKSNISSTAALFDVPRHLSFFSPKTLRAFLNKAGFENVWIGNAAVIRNQSKLKTAAKFAVKALSDMAYYATFGHVTLSYSIVAVACKPPS
jgi:2-polyprenyl-3-methyl-5-hydroxy-6-metoxy-1,4-benzoquinol methylase